MPACETLTPNIKHPMASPLHAPATGLPPTAFICGERLASRRLRRWSRRRRRHITVHVGAPLVTLRTPRRLTAGRARQGYQWHSEEVHDAKVATLLIVTRQRLGVGRLNRERGLRAVEHFSDRQVKEGPF